MGYTKTLTQSSTTFLLLFFVIPAILLIIATTTCALSDTSLSTATQNLNSSGTAWPTATQISNITNATSTPNNSIVSPTPTPTPNSNSSISIPDKVIVGYYPSWKSNQLAVNNLFWNKLTHVNYAFALLSESFTPNLLSGSTLNTLVWYAHASNVKVLLSIGGWTGSQKFSPMAADVTGRATFINATMSMVKQYNLDGIDLDWEYPGRQGLPCNIVNNQSDTSNLLLLLQELKTALGPDKLLTAAVRPETFDTTNGLLNDVSEFAKVLDWVNVMAYDINVDDGSGADWTKITGPNAPLDLVAGKGRQLSFTQAANSWLKAGMPASKIVMGVEFLGRGQTALDPMADGNQYVGRGPVVPQGDALDTLSAEPCPGANPQYSGVWLWRNLRQQGILKCTLTATEGIGWTRYFDNITQTPWLYNAGTKLYISYDDPQSLYIKIDYIKQQGLRGIMIWELTSDNGHELLDVIQSIQQSNSTPPSNDCSAVAPPDNFSSPSSGSGAGNGHLYAGTIIGLVLGCVILLSLVGLGFLWYRKKMGGTAVSRRPSTAIAPEKSEFVIAMFDYKGKEEGDLSFRKGDMIEVLEKGDDPNDWWVGRINGIVGEFPGNYVSRL